MRRKNNANTIVSVRSSSGNNADTVSLLIRGREIFYETSEWVNPTCDFAIWASLPIAMRVGGVLQINGATSAVAREKAERISMVWSTWLPNKFRPVRVTSEGYLNAEQAKTDKALMLYSGGVDSTFALKRYVEEGNSKPDLLTIHGMDYRREDYERFSKLQTRTAQFREKYANSSIEVRSNAASVMRRFGVPSSIGHGFQLFSTLFLFDSNYGKGLISADFTASQDYLTIPWGTNSLTNPMFRGNRMHIETLSNDVTRGEKIRALFCDELALETLSFCKNYAVRPANCGTCSKCVRTKAMFHAAGLPIPDIFLIGGFDPNDLRFLDLSKPIEVAFCMDVIDMAVKSNRLDDFNIVLEKIHTRTGNGKLTNVKNKIASYLRGYRAGV